MLTLNLKINKFRPFRWTKDDFARFDLSGRATDKSVLQYAQNLLYTILEGSDFDLDIIKI